MSVATVIPARNEARKISRVFSNINLLDPDLVVVVINGCTDNTLEKAIAHGTPQTHIIEFTEPLGVDVPRAVGAKYAHWRGAEIVVFIDGDMSGSLNNALFDLVRGIKSGTDLALTNCYPYITDRLPLTTTMLNFRKILNQELGLFRELGVASPSQGPHAVSRQLLDTVGFENLAVPPVELALARLSGLKIRVHAAVPHNQLDSEIKSQEHTRAITELIIGDCVEAINLIRSKKRSRIWNGVVYNGYNRERRWDLLRHFLNYLDKQM